MRLLVCLALEPVPALFMCVCTVLHTCGNVFMCVQVYCVKMSNGRVGKLMETGGDRVEGRLIRVGEGCTPTPGRKPQQGT